MKRLIISFSAVLALLALLAGHLSGCAGPSYYAQAISGHLGLMKSREQISDLLADTTTDEQLAERLQKADQIRKFAETQLGLSSNGSYSQVVITGKKAVTWNVVAAPEFSIKPRLWCFPVSGCVPYRGYFDHERAKEFSLKMQRKSLDVMISPAVAYSTLGWFEDPLIDTMFQYSEAQLAGIMFHELAHQKLYVKSDTAFSEAFASFVEETGVRKWMSSTGQNRGLTQWEARNRAAIEFNGLLKTTQQQLQELYASEQSDELKRQAKIQVFDDLRNGYQGMVTNEWKGKDYFANWMSADLNNAHLALMDSYEGGLCAFTALYEESGKDLARFYTLAEEKAALGKAQRQVWLDRSCAGFVSDEELVQFISF